MPRKKEPPPSALPPHRSTRGISKSTSHTDGEDMEALMVPLVGLGDSQEGSANPPQPSSSIHDHGVCNINKENSAIPSVTVSLDDSEQGIDMIGPVNTAEKSAGNIGCAGFITAGKTGLDGENSSVGLSVSDSSGSIGVPSGTSEGSGDVRYTGMSGSTSPVTCPGSAGSRGRGGSREPLA
ncbi:hypothetical protein L1987_18866 [Smallanthus sonchifolius]|uniref:Uncharacterized protein n=1 Tax=Smallanthus sonchifolius TaxID=185202 RepID=A0ACB9J0S1_9ASTR|nr:hypothetical protein L1987_18866 [Smallanthus sonchifolius]